MRRKSTLGEGKDTSVPTNVTTIVENTTDKWYIPWYTARKRCITILYHAIENTEAKPLLNFDGNKIAAHHGKVGCNTVECTAVFLHSDWLYFLWHSIK